MESSINLINVSASMGQSYNTYYRCSNGVYHYGSSCNCSTTTYTWLNTYPTTVYMYQLKCPKCKKMNWGELEKIVTCKGCSAKLKGVTDEVDYEIPVEK